MYKTNRKQKKEKAPEMLMETRHVKSMKSLQLNFYKDQQPAASVE